MNAWTRPVANRSKQPVKTRNLRVTDIAVRPVGASKAHLIFTWRQTGFAFKELPKRADVTISDTLTHLIKFDWFRFEQLLCHFDAKALEVFQWRQTHCLFEASVKRTFAYSQMFGKLSQLNTVLKRHLHTLLSPGDKRIGVPMLAQELGIRGLRDSIHIDQ
ncbi:Uncharacterised protein [Pandoraea pulmonicola]|uniref:Uncharacterized protein n=1 Tax=Pandoraea pulmonicola TaxID=93221 RepID=A0AAJ5CYP0_PANPU|nr:Uncharacterised protein [Pandoraea pulmonicola]